MTILHLVNSLDLCDGCARHVGLLAREQARHHQVVILTGRGDLVEGLRARNLNIEIEPLLAHEQRSLPRFVLGCLAVKKWIARIRPNLVHAHHYYAGHLAHYAARGRLPMVLTVHAALPPVGRLSHFPGDHLIAVSTATKRHILAQGEVPVNRITTIPNAVEVLIPADPPSPVLMEWVRERRSEGRMILLFAGRMVEEKGVAVLAEALRHRDSRDELALVVAGDGPLRSLLQGDDLPPVFLQEPLPSIDAVLRMCDLLVLPSLRMEGLPMVVLEAGLAGCAVLASATDGVDDVIEQGVTGRLLPPGDVRALREELHLLRNDPELRSALASALHRRVRERHNPTRHAADVDAVYRKLVP